MGDRAYDRLIAALEASGRTVKPNGDDHAMAQCSGHDDGRPSLSLKAGRECALVKCFAGCDAATIMAGLGLSERDLFDDREGVTYRYDDGNRWVRRYAGKKFKQGGPKTTTILYGRDAVLQAGPGAVYLVEGEKDVDTIAGIGAVACSAPMGADNVDKCDLSPLHGRDVVAIADRDLPGLTWAQKVRGLLGGKAASLRFAQARVGKDATDHILAGHGLQELVPLQLDEPEPEVEGEVEPTTWEPIDLGPYLRGEIVRPEPTVGVVRRDGLALLYPGKEHSIIGEMESGKSWLALACAAAEITRGNHVVYIHFEEIDPSDTVERLQALGVPDADIVARFRFVGPQRRAQADWLDALVDPAPTLVVLDGVNEGMSLFGAEVRVEDGVAMFRRKIVKPFTGVGAAVLSLDHVVKDKEGRGRYALGSVHKGNALSGSLILLETAEPFGRGMRGRSHVAVLKDRPGHLRRNGRPDAKLPGKTYMGELVVDDTHTWAPYLELAFLAPADEPVEQGDDDDELDARVLDAVRAIQSDGKEPTARAVRVKAKRRHAAVADSLERLVLADKIEVSRGRSNVYTVPDDLGNQSGGAEGGVGVVPGSGSKDPGTGNQSPPVPGTSGNHGNQSPPVPGTSGNQWEPVDEKPVCKCGNPLLHSGSVKTGQCERCRLAELEAA